MIQTGPADSAYGRRSDFGRRNANLIINEHFTTGVFSRNFKTGGLLLQAIVGKIRFGYAYELPIASSSSLNFATHELAVGIGASILSYHEKAIKTF